MSNLALISAFVGIVMPLIVSVINQEHWSSQLKGLVALIVSFVAAAVTTWAEGGLHGHSLASSFLIAAAFVPGGAASECRPSRTDSRLRIVRLCVTAARPASAHRG